MKYYQWSKRKPGAPYNRSSPSLQLLRSYLLDTFGGQPLGIYGVRPIRGGSAWSTHSFGAALDWRYWNTGAGYRPVTVPIDAVLAFLIANADRIGVQMIGEEQPRAGSPNGRIWIVGRGWKNRPITAARGGAWLHIEIHPDRWADTTPIADRIAGAPPHAPPSSPVPPIGEKSMITVMLETLRLGSKGSDVERAQALLAVFGPAVKIDGQYGTQTERAVRDVQHALGLTVDGVTGPQTWRAMLEQ